MVVVSCTRAFKNLGPADGFAFSRKHFVKLATKVLIEWSKGEANAVCLESGEPTFFEPNEQVIFLPKARIETE